MSRFTGFTYSDDFVFEVSDLSDGSLAVYGNVSHFAAGHFERSELAFLSHKLSSHTGGSRKLSALARLKFDVVYHRTDGNSFQGKRVAGFDVRFRAAIKLVAYLNAVRSENVSLFAVRIAKKRDVGGSVRIVFDSFDYRFDTVFVSRSKRT